MSSHKIHVDCWSCCVIRQRIFLSNWIYSLIGEKTKKSQPNHIEVVTYLGNVYYLNTYVNIYFSYSFLSGELATWILQKMGKTSWSLVY